MNIICEKEGVACFDVLTGFKYIGELAGEWERTGEHSFILGFEESYGYLAGDFVRDKDAVIAAALISEMTLYYKKEKNMSLYEALQNLFGRYGFSREELVNVGMTGKDGMEKMDRIMDELRKRYKDIFASQRLKIVEDFKTSVRTFAGTGETEKIDLPSSNVLKFTFDDGAWLVLRPSGTEPKIKLYLFAVRDSAAAAQNRVDELKALVKNIF